MTSRNHGFTLIEMLIEKPRRFVETQLFFGPDRRRRKGDDYQGPLRRENDDSGKGAENKAEAELLRQLRQDAKNKTEKTGR